MKKRILLCIFILLIGCVMTGCASNVTTKEEKIEKPTADGIEKNVYDLSFYIPEDFTSNSYNGMMGVYNYYSGEMTGREIDVTVVVTSMEKYEDIVIKEYIETKSIPAKAINLTETKEEKINGKIWYIFENDNANYFGTEYDDYAYEVKVEKKNNPEGKYEQTVSMVKKTLFFEKEE